MSENRHLCSRCGTQLGQRWGGMECAACVLERLVEAPADDSTATIPGSFDSPPVQHRFGSYELLEEIGRGGMGVIYRARQSGLDRIVALKMLLAGEFAEPSARSRLLREARTAARLKHPGIVSIVEVGEQDGRLFFAMEHVAGNNLASTVQGGVLPPSEAARIIGQVADAVQYAHSQGIIHRDLKPSNILVNLDNQLKLTDFGLTKVLHEPGFSGTIESAGTPNFMAPEQADPKLAATGVHTDVFGLGAVLYYLLTGRPPFVGDSLAETLRAAVLCEPIAPRTLRPGIPPDLETICMRCLEREPGRRYASAAEVAAELARWRNHEPIRARRAGVVERVSKWVRRRPVVAALGAACLIALIAGLISTTWQWRRAERQREATEWNNYIGSLNLAERYITEGNVLAARNLLLPQPEHLRGWEWGRLLALAYPELLTVSVFTNWSENSFRQPVPWNRLSDDGSLLAVAGDGLIRVFRTRTGELLRLFGATDNPASFPVFDPTSRLMGARGPGRGFTIWDTRNWEKLWQFDDADQGDCRIAFHPNRPLVVTASGTNAVRVWDIEGVQSQRVMVRIRNKAMRFFLPA